MRFEVIGGGSIGMLLAAKLALAGKRVLLRCRTDEQAFEIDRYGITLYEGNETATTKLDAAGPGGISPDVSAKNPPDWLIIALKQKDITEAFALELSERTAGSTRVLCFQNGIGHMELLGKQIRPDVLYSAVTTEGARKLDLTRVAHTGSGETLIGRPLCSAEEEDGEPAKQLQALLNCLNQAGFSACLSNNIRSAIWNKLLINAVINPLTAVLRVANGELLRSSEWIETMKVLFAEGQAVAREMKIATSETLWEQLLSVCERTAANHSSMLQDIEAGRETELEWITGGLLRLGESTGVPLPAHRMLYHLIKGMELLARQK